MHRECCFFNPCISIEQRFVEMFDNFFLHYWADILNRGCDYLLLTFRVFQVWVEHVSCEVSPHYLPNKVKHLRGYYRDTTCRFSWNSHFLNKTRILILCWIREPWFLFRYLVFGVAGLYFPKSARRSYLDEIWKCTRSIFWQYIDYLIHLYRYKGSIINNYNNTI